MNKWGKRLVSVLCMLSLAAIPVAEALQPAEIVLAEEKDYKIDGLKWGFDKSTGTITEVPKEWKGGELPSEIEGTKVTKVGERAGTWHQKIRKLIIPEGVTEIEASAFMGCHYIEYLKFPSTLIKLGERAFQNCDQVETLECAGDKSKIKCEDGATRGLLCHHPDFSEPYKNSEYYQKLMDVKLTGNFVEDAFLIAASQEGYHEGDSFLELDGSNKKGGEDYVEMGYYRDTMEFQYFPDNYETKRWGGWCGMFVEWVYDMAGAPAEVMDVFNYPCQLNCTWSTTLYGGGTYELKHGDMLHFDKGHYTMVDRVEYDKENDRLKVYSWNGNPDVHYDCYEFEASTGMELEDYGNGQHRYLNFYFPVDEAAAAAVPSHKLTFDPAGGKLTVSEKKVYEEALYGILPVPVKEGYTFDGWYTGRSGKGHLVSAYRTVRINKDRTLYAKWLDQNGNVWQDPNETGKEELELYPEDIEDSEGKEALIVPEKDEVLRSDLKTGEQTVFIDIKGSSGEIKAENISKSKLKKYMKLKVDGRKVLATFKKKAKKGKYKIRVTVNGYSDYKWTQKTVTIKVK